MKEAETLERTSPKIKTESKEGSKRTRKKIAEVVIAASILGPGMGAIGEYCADDSLLIPHIISYYGQGIQKSAAAVSDKEANAVREVMLSSKTSYEILEDSFFVTARKAAEKNNLTLIDQRPFVDRISGSQNVEETLGILNEATSSYGFSVKIPERRLILERDYIKTLERKEVNNDMLKKGSMKLLKNLQLIPKEVFSVAGVRGVRIVKDMGRMGEANTSKAAEIVLFTRNINITLQSFMAPEFFIHEFFHAIDFSTNGNGFASDDLYGEINPPGFVYGGDNPNAVEKKIVSRGYGDSDVKEDKATLSERLLPIIDVSMFRPDNITYLDRKAEIILARIQKEVASRKEGADYISYLRAIS